MFAVCVFALIMWRSVTFERGVAGIGDLGMCGRKNGRRGSSV